MTADQMERALQALGTRLKEMHTESDIVIAGGAWMTLVLGSRGVTKDLDAYLSPPAEPVRRATEQVAEELGLPSDWLNDSIKGFFFGTPPQILWRTYEGLRVYAVTTEYMLALKIFAARDADRTDVKVLIDHLGLVQVSEVLRIVEQYIPHTLLTPKHQYFAESCLE